MYLIGTGVQRAAKRSRVIVGGNTLTFASYEATLNGDDLQTVNFESYASNATPPNTYDEGILGVFGCDWRCGGDWDAAQNPLASASQSPGLYPRDDLQALQFVVSRAPGIPSNPESFWSFPWARVRSSVNSGEVKGKVAFNASGKNQGPFLWPVGEVSPGLGASP